MALHVLTNERDKEGKLIEQLIVTDQEEAYYRKLAVETYHDCQRAEYKAMGLPFGSDEADEVRGRIFRTLVFFHKVGRWVLITMATLLTMRIMNDTIGNIEVGFKE